MRRGLALIYWRNWIKGASLKRKYNSEMNGVRGRDRPIGKWNFKGFKEFVKERASRLKDNGRRAENRCDLK